MAEVGAHLVDADARGVEGVDEADGVARLDVDHLVEVVLVAAARAFGEDEAEAVDVGVDAVDHLVDLVADVAVHLAVLPLGRVGGEGVFDGGKIVEQLLRGGLDQLAEQLAFVGEPTVQHARRIPRALGDGAHGRALEALFHKFFLRARQNAVDGDFVFPAHPRLLF